MDWKFLIGIKGIRVDEKRYGGRLMPCDLKYQIKITDNIERAKATLLKAGYGVIDPPYLDLLRAGRMSIANFGFKYPRPMTLILKLVGLSPGIVKLWHDAESGFFSEARAKPGAPPVYHHISDDQAITILKGEMTHELEDYLLEPDPYLGE